MSRLPVGEQLESIGVVPIELGGVSSCQQAPAQGELNPSVVLGLMIGNVVNPGG